MNIKKIIGSKRLQIISLLLGAVVGLVYWKFVGCKSGTCPIKSVWYWTMLWGAVIGYLIGDITNDIIQKRVKREREKR